MNVTVHVGEAKSPCPARRWVVRSAPYGCSHTLATGALGAHAASGPRDDSGAGGGPRSTAGRSGPVESDGRGVGPTAGAQLAQFLPAALGGSAPDDTVAPRAWWTS